MPSAEIIVNGNPMALKRHRMTRSGHSYDPSAKEKQEFLLKVQNKAPKTPFECPIAIHAEFLMQRPKNHYRTGKNSHVLKDTAPIKHTGRPDLDNLVKFVCDALNGIFYRDDAQIYRINAVKYYSATPQTIVRIYVYGKDQEWNG